MTKPDASVFRRNIEVVGSPVSWVNTKSIMPFTVKGVGTAYYGGRDFRPDGSYVTTEWVVLAHFPVVPLRSLRVIGDLGLDEYYYVCEFKKFIVVERLPLNWGQVASMYRNIGSVLVSAAAFLFLAFKLGFSIEKYPFTLSVLTVIFASIPAVVAALRWKRTKESVVVTDEAFLATLSRLGITPDKPSSVRQETERADAAAVTPRRHSPSEGYYDY